MLLLYVFLWYLEFQWHSSLVHSSGLDASHVYKLFVEYFVNIYIYIHIVEAGGRGAELPWAIHAVPHRHVRLKDQKRASSRILQIFFFCRRNA
jgi:hypothetical protein